jgi:hypothetical protein
MAMRDDARQLLDDLPDEEMTLVVQFLRSVKALPSKQRRLRPIDPGVDSALTDLVRTSEDLGLYQQDYSDYYARFQD